MEYSHNRGFTLIELSIVMVIIGLMIGGMLVGRDMIRAAEIRATLRQIERIETAMNTFKAKYKCLPGDCANADDMGFVGSPLGMLISQRMPQPDISLFATLMPISDAWAAPVPIPIPVPDPSSFEIVGTNGNGDGKLNNYAEYFNAVYMLMEAKLIGDLNMVTYQIPLPLRAASSTNVQGNWLVMYLNPSANASVPVDAHYLWASATPYENSTGAAVLLPRDAAAIDMKRDDGKPRSGLVRASGRNDTDLADVTRGPFFDSNNDTGAAGATSNVCITNASPNGYNFTNESRAAGSLCTLTIKASF
jgi:prepilin-type N-terminal cleavage/methylation domain-containing protein